MSAAEYDAARRWYTAQRIATARDNFWWAVVATTPAIVFGFWKTNHVERMAPALATIPCMVLCAWCYDTAYGDHVDRLRRLSSAVLREGPDPTV